MSTIKKTKPITIPESTSAIDLQTNSHPSTHCSQIIPVYDTSFFKSKKYFQGFFPPNDSFLDLKTLQQQQSQDPVLRTVYSWLTHNDKLEFLTLALLFSMHIKNDSHNFLLMILQTSLLYTKKLPILLQHNPTHFQIQYNKPNY